jgi:lysophospholipase L1-like esterase
MNRATRIVSVNVSLAVVLLLVFEFASRALHPVDLTPPLITRPSRDWAGSRIPDPVLFWRMRPHFSINGERVVNSLGIRGPEIPSPDPLEFRILSLGESTTFARRLPYEKCYSSLLERELPSLDGRRVRVINAGVPGYSLFQGVTYLRIHGLEFQPDAVISYFGYNDFLPVAFRVERDSGSDVESAGMTDRQLFRKRNSISSRLMYWLRRHSNLVRTLSQRTPPSMGEIRAGLQARVPEEDRLWLYTELRNLCNHNDIRLAIVIPWYRYFDEHISLLRQLSDWKDVIIVDLPAMLNNLSESPSEFFADEIHPNEQGHRLIAQAIERELLANWHVSTSRASK